MGEENRLRLLFHYASLSEIEGILAASQLRTSPLPDARLRLGRPHEVVWLTDADTPGVGLDHGIGGPMPVSEAEGKRQVRFTLSVADAQYWPEWARRRVARRVRRELDDAGGGLSARWWVVTRAIPAKEWVCVDDLASGARLWPPGGH